MIPLEINVQGAIEGWMEERGLYTKNILYSRSQGDFLKISFILKPEVQEFLEILGYRELADKSGVIVCPDGYTIGLRGIALGFFLSKLDNG